jgi:hypothetical protein
VTKYVEVTMWELLQKVHQEEKDGHRKPGEDEKCCICLCELYDDLETKPESDVKAFHEKQMKQEVGIDVVIMSKCTDHCFHKECLQMQMNG